MRKLCHIGRFYIQRDVKKKSFKSLWKDQKQGKQLAFSGKSSLVFPSIYDLVFFFNYLVSEEENKKRSLFCKGHVC